MNFLDFNTYQDEAVKLAIYPKDARITYPTLGLCGETGEVAEKIKKSIRDGRPLNTEELAKELGDVLWYIAALAHDLDLSLERIAMANLRKLWSRKERDVLKGDGDNR